MKNYQCRKCGTLISNESYPNANGCPNGGSHQWNNLGEYNIDNGSVLIVVLP